MAYNIHQSGDVRPTHLPNPNPVYDPVVFTTYFK